MPSASAVPFNGGALDIFLIFLRLGCLSFGGPVAHLGYFREEFVERRRWLTDIDYAQIVALAQSLPGPASSQVGFALGLNRAGVAGGLAAWLGFTLPSAVLMLAFALGHALFASRIGLAILHGLQLVAVAVVAQAVMTMWRNLVPDRSRAILAIAAAALVLFLPPSFGTPLAILLGALVGLSLPMQDAPSSAFTLTTSPGRRTPFAAPIAGVVFSVLLLVALWMSTDRLSGWALMASFYRTGASVFGGGNVVLPLLNQATVAKGWTTPEIFLAGYGMAQAMPGPLFTFAAYLGAVVRPNPRPVLYGVGGLICIFLPGLLLMTAALPVWSGAQRYRRAQAALQGVNASVVGVLIAALYRPVWTSAVASRGDFWMVLAAFVALTAWQLRPWAVVLGTALAMVAKSLAQSPLGS